MQTLPNRLTLPEALGLLVDHLGCAEIYAQNLLERALYTRTLRDIMTLDPDGSELPTDVRAWREIEWDSGIVKIEPSWSGSPPTYVNVFAAMSRDELLRAFGIDALSTQVPTPSRGGRPTQHDWDAFWIEVCRWVHQKGLPQTQKEFVDRMLHWFANRRDERVD